MEDQMWSAIREVKPHWRSAPGYFLGIGACSEVKNWGTGHSHSSIWPFPEQYSGRDGVSPGTMPSELWGESVSTVSGGAG